MNVHFKISGPVYSKMIQDLRRRHPFAAERIGFLLGRLGTLADGRLVLLNQYHSIPDEQYVKDRTVGARIGGDAIAWAMTAAYQGRSVREGVFHVHLHDHNGPTGMSPTDSREIPALIPGFRSVSGKAAHGIIILSRNHGSGWVWLPGSPEPMCAESIQVIGVPIGVFEGRGKP